MQAPTQASHSTLVSFNANHSGISRQNTMTKRQGWWCNLSSQYKLLVNDVPVCSVAKRGHSQYSLMVAMMQSGQFDTIFFVSEINAEQADFLGKLQKNSGTRLIHARLAYQFMQKIA